MNKLNYIIEPLAKIPGLWHLYQDWLGANQRKLKTYRSVFDKPGSLLDFGCSNGNTAEAFLDFDFYGVDIDAATIADANKRFEKYPNINFYALDILKDNFKTDFFDYVLFAGTGHHLTTENFLKIFKILINNLKPNGEMHFFDIIKQPSKDRLSTRLLTKFDRGPYVRTQEDYFNLLKDYTIVNQKIYPSPDRLIKEQDFLYLKIIR